MSRTSWRPGDAGRERRESIARVLFLAGLGFSIVVVGIPTIHLVHLAIIAGGD